MSKKVYIFWSLFVALAFFRLWQSFDDTSIRGENCLKQSVIGAGKIISEPEKKESGQVFVILADRVVSQTDREVCGLNFSIKVKTKLYPSYRFNDQISFEGKISAPINFENNDGRVFDYVGYLAKDDIYLEIKSAKIAKLHDDGDIKDSVTQDFVDKNSTNKFLIEGYNLSVSKLFELKKSFVHSLQQNLGEPHSALAGGLVVGEKSALGKQLLDDFRKVGLIHIVVLSGYNITIVADAMRRMLSFLPRIWGIIFGGIGVALFGTLVGGGATVVRSCLMAGIALTADLARRDYSVMRALLFVGLLMLIENPKILFHDPSFQLSFLATLGMILLAGPIENKILFITEKFGMRGIVASTFASLIFVSPYILYTMGQISIVGVVVNILVLPFIPITMLFVFLAGVIGMLSVSFAIPFAWVSHFLLSYELFMVEKFAKLPFASLNVGQFSPWWVVGFYGVVGVLMWRRKFLFKDRGNDLVVSSKLNLLFKDFQKLSRDILIDNPNELVYTDLKLTEKSSLFILDDDSIIFTRRTLKHLAEKGGKGKIMFEIIPTIIVNPDSILKGRLNRFIFVKLYNRGKKKEPHVVIIEKTLRGNIVITSFVTDEKYLKNFEILWRTGGSLS